MHGFSGFELQALSLKRYRAQTQAEAPQAQTPHAAHTEQPPLFHHKSLLLTLIPFRSQLVHSSSDYSSIFTASSLSQPPGLTLGLEQAENVVLANCG